MEKYILRIVIGIFLLSSIQGISSEVVKEDKSYQRILKITPPQQRPTETPSKQEDLKTTERFKHKQYYIVNDRVAYRAIASQNTTDTHSH